MHTKFWFEIIRVRGYQRRLAVDQKMTQNGVEEWALDLEAGRRGLL
jgi:hypothetical protein